MLLTPTFRVVLLSAALAAPGFARSAAASGDDSTPVTPVTAPKGPAAPPAPQVPTPPEDRAGYDPAGIKGLLIGELSVRGVMRTSGKLLAIVQAPDNKTYTVHSGDALYDGTIKVVANDAVIFLQRVDDPLSPVKQREIRKPLRTTEENR